METPAQRSFRGWHQRVAGVTAEVNCGGERHRIAWRRGKLVLEDHEVLAERALVAFGGQPPVCLELLDAWGESRDAGLLTRLLRTEGTLSSEELAERRERHEAELRSARLMPQRMLAEYGDGPDRAKMKRLLERQAAERLEEEARTWAATLMEMLPLRLRWVLALSIVVRLGRRWEGPAPRREQVEPALTALAAPLWEHGVRSRKRKAKAPGGSAARFGVLPPGEDPTCVLRAGREGPYPEIGLPLSWFTDVWGRGMALVDGYFVLGLADDFPDALPLRVLAVRWRRRWWGGTRLAVSPARLSRNHRGAWRLRWE